MILSVECKKFKPTVHLKDFIIKKTSYCINEFLGKTDQVKVFLGKNGKYCLTTLMCNKGRFSFHSHAQSRDVYASISIAANRMKTQLSRHKRGYSKRMNFVPLSTSTPDIHIEDYSENGLDFIGSNYL